MAPQSARPIKVFFSYSHKDEGLRDQLENHLSTLRREGVIESWHDRRISAGREWEGQIDDYLSSADIILLLTSSDFLASDYCYDVEVKRAMERHEAAEARVVPIILRPCDWRNTPFKKVQVLPKDGKPLTRWDDLGEAFLNIAEGIRKVAGELNSRQRVEPLPPAEPPKTAPHLHIPDILRVPLVSRKDREGYDAVERLIDELAGHANENALSIYRRLNSKRNIAVAIHQSAILAQERGDVDEARRLYGESLEISRKLDDQSTIADSLHSLGGIAQDQGEMDEARRLSGESLEIKKKLGDQLGIAFALHQLGALAVSEGSFQEAEELLGQSLSILRKLKDKQNIAECLESMGNLRVAQGRYPEAETLFAEALELSEALKIKYRIGSVKNSLGLLLERQGGEVEAARLFREALIIFKELASPKEAEARRNLERVGGEAS